VDSVITADLGQDRFGLNRSLNRDLAAEARILLYIMELRARFTFRDRSEMLRSETILL